MYRELRGILEEENGLRDAEMFVDGRRICDYRSRSMAFLKEESSHTMLFEDLTVCDNLCLGLDGKIPLSG